MKSIKIIGLTVFIFSFSLFIISSFLSKHKLAESSIGSMKLYHAKMLKEVASDALKPLLETTKAQLDKRCGIDPSQNIWNATTLPEGVQEWDYRMSDYDIKTYIPSLTKATVVGGMVPDNPGLFFFLIFGLGSLGGLMYILSDLKKLPGINTTVFIIVPQ